MQQVGVPTLLLIGTNDSLMGELGAVRELASNVPDLTIIEIEAGHLMGMEKPEEVNQLVLNFFE
ncbi:MAG: alpha/beta hydrolase [Anaerolineales bacterium]|nr:alpha/beta hydrolase [Anaerolineales bacterium]